MDSLGSSTSVRPGRDPANGEEDLLQFSPARRASDGTIPDDLDDFLNPNRPQGLKKNATVPRSLIDNENLLRDLMDSVTFDVNRSGVLMDMENVPCVVPGFDVVQPERAIDSLTHGEVLHNITDIQESVQINSEVDTRTYYNTMRQGASQKEKGKCRALVGKFNLNPAASPFKPKAQQNVPPKTVDITEEFTEALSERIKLMVTSMRIWHGEVVLEVQFGRILTRGIANNLIAWGDSHLSYPAEEMEYILSRSSQALHFTRILTTLGADAQFVVDLKNASNEPMWKNDPKFSVVYEFECYDHEKSTWFMVEMDAGTSETKVKSLPKEVGTVYVHSTLRNWDYRISATGLKNLEKDYGHVAKEIIQNIYIGWVHFRF